jgi:hypothetical protein
VFHKWGAIGTLSAVMGRRIWFDQSYYLIYPNLYIVFVGEPGDKKSTAMNLAMDLVQKTKTPICPPSITKEALTQMMSESNKEAPCATVIEIDHKVISYSHLSMFASEIVTMLSAGGNPIGMIEFLTDIYDREVFDVVTKNKGTDRIIGPYITMLACMTPEQTGQMLKQSIITGGFSRRVVFIYGKSKEYGIPFPELTDQQREAKVLLLSYLNRIKEWSGSFHFSPEAREFFIEWYQQKHAQLAKPNPAAYKNWLRSKDVILIKVAMLLVVSEFSGDKTIHLRHAQEALNMLDEVEPNLSRIFAGAGRNIGAELANKVMIFIRETGQKSATRKQILAALYTEGNAKEIDEALDFLTTTGKLNRKVLSAAGLSVVVFGIAEGSEASFS